MSPLSKVGTGRGCSFNWIEQIEKFDRKLEVLCDSYAIFEKFLVIFDIHENDSLWKFFQETISQIFRINLLNQFIIFDVLQSYQRNFHSKQRKTKKNFDFPRMKRFSSEFWLILFTCNNENILLIWRRLIFSILSKKRFDENHLFSFPIDSLKYSKEIWSIFKMKIFLLLKSFVELI